MSTIVAATEMGMLDDAERLRVISNNLANVRVMIEETRKGYGLTSGVVEWVTVKQDGNNWTVSSVRHQLISDYGLPNRKLTITN